MDCKKCTGIYALNCRCGGRYCVTHLGRHDCKFDFLAENRIQLEKDNPLVIAEKLKKI